jgi:hypothetical protein
MGRIGRAVRIALEKEGLEYAEERLTRLRDQAKEIYENASKILDDTQ